MKVETRVKLHFLLFTILVTSIVSGLALYYIKEIIDLFVDSPNRDLAAVMAHRLLFKSLVSFTGVTFFVSATALAVGSLIFRRISGSFLKSVAEITGLAEKRLGKGDETAVLQEYLTLLIEDQQRLNHYEKVLAWKDGARLLIHEVKNPLTPLKLSLQNIAMNSDNDDIDSALTSVSDIENILKSFKELVNIEYGETYQFNFISFWNNLIQQFSYSYPNLKILNQIEENELLINSEECLLKIVLINLIQNGIDANEEGFTLHLQSTSEKIEISAVTEERTIQEIEKVFLFGVSQKGSKRGYGLFLCRKISDYLNLNLHAENGENSVRFTFSIMRSK